MPFALLLIGAVILVAAIRGTHTALGKQVVSDFTGSGNFLIWLAAIAAIGALGYSPVLRTPSRMLLALIVLAMLLANRGFFDKFKQLLGQAPAAVPATQDQPLTGSVPVTLQGGQQSAPGGGGNGGGPGQALGTAAKVIGGLFGAFA